MIDLYLNALVNALSLQNLLYVLGGAFLGTLMGIIPGIGSVAGIAMLLPLTYGMDPAGGLIFLAGVYYGTEYGGSTTAILLRTPGDAGNAVTCLDGYEIARNGRPKLALSTAAIASFVAGITATIALMFLTEPLTKLAIRIAPPEYFSIGVLALILAGSLGGKSPVKGLLMVVFGLLIATVGMDSQTGIHRFTFGFRPLVDGVPFIVAASGLFAVSELLHQVNHRHQVGGIIRLSAGKWISRPEIIRILPPALRGAIIGFISGTMPGAGGATATFVSYGVEKSLSKSPQNFGKGEIEGLAGPEASNNAAAQGAMLPLFTLGIPASATGAVLIGAFMIFGLEPGPTLMARNPDLVWTIIVSMFIGNMALLVLNFPMIPIFAKILDIPTHILYTIVTIFILISVLMVRGEPVDIFILALFGFAGWILRRNEYPLAPVLMGIVLGSMMENALRRSLAISLGDPIIFVQRPISATLLGIALLVVLYRLQKYVRSNFWKPSHAEKS